MTIKDFVEKNVVIGFTSTTSLKEFAKMCKGHNLKMAVTGRDVSEFLNTSAESLFEHWLFGRKNVVHLVCGFCSDGVTWSNCNSIRDERYEERGYKIVTFEEFKSENNTPYKIVIECNGNDVTTAKMIINGKTIKESKAKRNPEDKFDFKIASNVAFNRLFERE